MQRINEHRFNTFRERYDFIQNVKKLCSDNKVFIYKLWAKEQNGKYIVFVEIDAKNGSKYTFIQMQAMNIKYEVRY